MTILEQGIELGTGKGEEKMATLNILLIKERLFEDLERASKDIDFRKKLYKKYNI